MANLTLKHPSLVYASDIAEICKPLQRLGISYFSHVQVDNAGRFFAINNNTGFMTHYLSHKYYNVDIHVNKNQKFENFVIWDAIERDGASAKMHTEAAQFGVQHTFTIIESNANTHDYFHFATDKSCKSINHTYLNNLDVLKLFILFYKEKIAETRIFSNYQQYQFNIDPKTKGYEIKSIYQQINSHKNRLEFMRDLGLNHSSQANIIEQLAKQLHKPRSDLLILDNLSNTYLSSRETECLYLTLKGKTAKQIARDLGISYRTVETHLINIKRKMKVTSKSEIISKAFDFFVEA